MLLVVTLSAPLFNTQGATGAPPLVGWPSLHVRSAGFGAATGLMSWPMMLWSASFHLVMTSDKFTYLFGRAIPALSLVLTMVLRLVQVTAAKPTPS